MFINTMTQWKFVIFSSTQSTHTHTSNSLKWVKYNNNVRKDDNDRKKRNVMIMQNNECDVTVYRIRLHRTAGVVTWKFVSI